MRIVTKSVCRWQKAASEYEKSQGQVRQKRTLPHMAAQHRRRGPGARLATSFETLSAATSGSATHSDAATLARFIMIAFFVVALCSTGWRTRQLGRHRREEDRERRLLGRVGEEPVPRLR